MSVEIVVCSFIGSFLGCLIYNWLADDVYFWYVGWRFKRKSRKE